MIVLPINSKFFWCTPVVLIKDSTKHINDLSESGELGNENDSSASTGDHPDLDIKTSIGLHSSGGVTLYVFGNTTSEGGNTGKILIVFNHKHPCSFNVD
jgi:hypothetical protein